MEPQKYLYRLCWIGILLFLGLLAMYTVRIGVPLHSELMSIIETERDKGRWEKLAHEIKLKENQAKEELSALQKQYPQLAVANLQQRMEQILRNELATVLSLETKDSYLRSLETELSNMGREKTHAPSLLQMTFTIPADQMAVCMRILDHIGQYGSVISAKFQPADESQADGKTVSATICYQAWLLKFCTDYRAYEGNDKTSFSHNPFTTPSCQEHRITQADVSRLAVRKILFNPASPKHSFALLDSGRMICAGDDVEGIFVNKIGPAQVWFGYYDEVALSSQDK
jgi:hypothetical protein